MSGQERAKNLRTILTLMHGSGETQYTDNAGQHALQIWGLGPLFPSVVLRGDKRLGLGTKRGAETMSY